MNRKSFYTITFSRKKFNLPEPEVVFSTKYATFKKIDQVFLSNCNIFLPVAWIENISLGKY